MSLVELELDDELLLEEALEPSLAQVETFVKNQLKK